LNDSSTSFYEFGKKVALDTRGAHVWVQSMTKMTELEKHLQACKLAIQQHEEREFTLKSYLSQPIYKSYISNALNLNSTFNI
jgi:hypothetical protein